MNATEISTELLQGLSAPEARFVAEYQKDKNATKAYIRAGFKARGAVATSAASRMLRSVHVAAAIADLDSKNLAVIQARAGISLERTLVEIAKGAFFDVRLMFNADGSPKGIHELDDITASAIEGIEVVEQYAGSGEDRVFVGHVKKYKLAKRSTSLDMLMKHLNGYKAENDSKGAATASALLTLLGDMRRSSLPIVQQVDNDHGV